MTMQLDGRALTLVVDPSPEYQAWLKTDPACQLSPPVFATTGAEAQSILAKRDRVFAGIFVNPAVGGPGGLSVVRCAHLHHVGTPVYLLCDGESPIERPELDRLAVHEALKKPMTYAELVALVSPIMANGPPPDVVIETVTGPGELDQEAELLEQEFSPIRIDNFLSGHKSFFDVYARIRNGKFVKILMLGDAFSEERVESYLKKGVKTFFIRKSAQASYVAYCEHLSSKLSMHSSAPLELKLSQTLNAGEETIRFLSDRGVSPGGIAHAIRFAENIRRIVDDIDFDSNPAIAEYLSDAATYDHAVGTALVAGLLIPPLRITMSRLQNGIGLAAILHDVGMPKSARYLEDKDEHDMTDEEKRIYARHPQDGAKALMAVPGIDSIAIQAIYQHHERRDGKGFPKRAGAGAITLAAEIVGIADEFTRLLRRARIDKSIDPLARMRLHVFDGYSYRVMKAFIDVMWA